MKKRYLRKLFATLVIFMAVCSISAPLYAQEGQKEGDAAASDDGRKMSMEAQAALLEAQRRFETNPDDLAAARQPIIDFLKTPVEPIPDTLYSMIGQFWYLDEKNDKSIEEANKIYKMAHEKFPEDESFLLNYCITTYELERIEEAAPLFEEYYELMAEKDIKYLEYAAQTYYMAENLKEAKRIFVKLLGLSETPKDNWMLQIIGICQAMEDAKEEEKYIRLALDYFPMEKKYWRYLANVYLSKEDYTGGTAAFEIATRVALPEQKTEWRTLIDLYNYLGLPLRSAEGIQMGLDLLAKESSEEEQQLAIADAYARGARVDKAVAYLDSVIAKAPSYELRIKKATILYEARRNEEAIAALDDCIDMKSNAYDAYFMKGWVAWDMKNWKMAKSAFTESSNSRQETIRYTSEDALEMLASLDEAKKK
jgi:predicted Zn-dependent protease